MAIATVPSCIRVRDLLCHASVGDVLVSHGVPFDLRSFYIPGSPTNPYTTEIRQSKGSTASRASHEVLVSSVETGCHTMNIKLGVHFTCALYAYLVSRTRHFDLT